MAELPIQARSGRFANPRMTLHAVENRMAGIRRALAAMPHDSCSPGNLEDAVKLACIIERLAQAGQTAPAEDASAMVELIEIFRDDLLTKLRSV